MHNYSKLNMKNHLEKFVIATGCLATVITIITAPNDYWLRYCAEGIFAILCAYIMAVFINTQKKPQQFKANRDTLVSLQKSYYTRTADKTDIEWIAKLEAIVYDAGDAIPLDLLTEWHNANPLIFTVIVDKLTGNRVGHLNLLPVKQRTLSLLKSGSLRERDIRGDSLYTPAEKESVEALWVESIAIRLPDDVSSVTALRAVLSASAEVVNRLACPDKLQEILAIPVSKPGRMLCEHVGMELIQNKSSRVDEHDLYGSNFKNVSFALSRYAKRN